ncbi:MAG: sulfotransferase [Candidatus Binatia bacterium]
MQPIFIGGCERSGTTLLGAMLGSHRAYLCVPEMQFKFDIRRLIDPGQEDLVNASAILRTIARRASFRIWDLGLDLSALPDEQLTCRSLIEWLVLLYGRKVGKPAPRFWVDHTPKNIRYARTLFQLFPDARLIHIVRDGRAVAASVLPLDWGPNAIESAAHFWAERLAYGFAAESHWSEQVIRVRYEDLVRDPHGTLQDLCAVFGIPFDSAMSQANGFHVPQYTAGQHALIGQRPDLARVDGWKKQLTTRQVEIFESVTTDLLESLGYTPQFGLHARKISRRERLQASLQELIKQEVVNRYRKRRRKAQTIPSF